MIEINETMTTPIIGVEVGIPMLYKNDSGLYCGNITIKKIDTDGNAVETIVCTINPEDFNDFWENHYNSDAEIVEYVNDKMELTIPVPTENFIKN